MSTSVIPQLRRDDPLGLGHALAACLKSSIVAGELGAGDRVPSEAQLGRTYDVSRTVVREAVSQLKAEGLVETFQGRGSFVASAGPARSESNTEPLIVDLSVSRSARDIMELRRGFEPESAALAAGRRTDSDLVRIDAALADLENAIETGTSTIAADFAVHRAIATASGNPLVLSLISALGTQGVLLQRASLHDDVDVVSDQHGNLLRFEHRQIRDAVARGDAEGARATMFSHLSRSLGSIHD